MALPTDQSVEATKQGLLLSPSDGTLEHAKAKYLTTEIPINHVCSQTQEGTIIHERDQSLHVRDQGQGFGMYLPS